MTEPVATRVRVIYGDTDAGGIAYYAQYLRWFEIGRTEAIRNKGMAYRELTEQGIHLPVTRAEIRYLSPAKYDDLLTIRTGVGEVGRATLSFVYRIERQDGKPLAEGSTSHAFTNLDGKVVRPPAGFLEKMKS